MNLDALAIRFKLFGIPITIAPTFFLLGFLFYQWNIGQASPILATVEIMAWVLIAVLVHELGHALVVRYFGLQPQILLYMIGGRASWEQQVDHPLSNKQHILIALAGPLAGFLLGVLVWFYAGVLGGPMPGLAIAPDLLYRYVIYFTIYWSILNLLPMYPLDGGQVLFYALNQHPRWNARMITSIITLALGGGLILLSIRAGEWWVSLLLGFIIMNNYRLLQSSRDQQLNEKVAVVTEAVKAGRLEEAIEGAKGVLAEAKSEPFRYWAVSLLARLYAQEENWPAAAALARSHPEMEELLPEIKIMTLLNTEGTEAALTFARKALALHPTLNLACVNIGLLAKEGRYEQIQEWLQMTRSQPFYENLVSYVREVMQTDPHRAALADFPNLARWIAPASTA